MKNKQVLICITVIFIGLSVLLYPTIADLWNTKTQSQVMVDYEGMIERMKPEDFTSYYKAAEKYNKKLAEAEFPLTDTEPDSEYMKLLNLEGIGIIGTVSIEKIRVELPIYHTVADSVLSKAAGHMPGTSMPIGGESTHAVISAHRGLPSAKLFTNLDKLEEGDTFVITVLDRIMTYEVDQIKIVNPDEVENLYIVDGEDHVTLLTCTPYGLNTHRLLVRGTRTDTAKKRMLRVVSQGYVIDPVIVTPVVAVPMLFIFLVYSWIKAAMAPKKRKKSISFEDVQQIIKETGDKK